MSDLQKTILDTLGTTGGNGSDWLGQVLALPGRDVQESLSELARQLDQMRSTGQAQVDAVSENTLAVSQNTQAQGGKGAGSVVGEIAKTASGFLGGGLGLSPLLSGLIGLFRRDKQEPPPSLISYAAPAARNVEAAVGQSGGQPFPAVDYGQDGLPRAVPSGGATYAPQVTVQVQAMDSRSFLDHSAEIARAVREAVLNGHSLNDVLNEL